MADKKILYIVDYTLEEYNSVRDILYYILNHKEMGKYQNVIAKSQGNLYNPIHVDYSYGYKTYSFPGRAEKKLTDILKNKRYTVFEKIECMGRRIALNVKRVVMGKSENYSSESERYLRKIVKKEKPDLVIFLDYFPTQFNTDICVRHKIPFISMLYDTYICRPDIDTKTAFPIEKHAIENSEGYFVPNFFYSGYLKYYDNPKVMEYRLPLLIEKKHVLEAYEKTKEKYEFTYFGQIQSFRNGDKIKDIFRELEISLDVFSAEKYSSDDVFNIHAAITKEDLYNAVAGSKYLVAFDNGVPYSEYLPSKAYLYVSFTKPIIAFGDNETSALKTFFRDYPYFYYQDINDSTDGLSNFLNKIHKDSFDEEIYKQYLLYSPEYALQPVVKLVDKILKR